MICNTQETRTRAPINMPYLEAHTHALHALHTQTKRTLSHTHTGGTRTKKDSHTQREGGATSKYAAIHK